MKIGALFGSLIAMMVLTVGAAPARATYGGRAGDIVIGFGDAAPADEMITQTGLMKFALGHSPKATDVCKGTTCQFPDQEEWAPGGNGIARWGTRGLDVDGSDIDSAGHDATWAPDADRLAYIARGDVWVARSDATGMTQLTHLAGSFVTVLPPAWSPRGPLVIGRLRSHIEYNSDLFTVNPSTGKTRKLMIVPGRLTSIDWSPDGRHLLMVVDGKVAMATADGKHLRKLPIDATEATWSPDGKRFAALTGHYMAPLVVARANGSHPHTYPLVEDHSTLGTNDVRGFEHITWRPR